MYRNRDHGPAERGKRASGGKKPKRPSRLTLMHKFLIVVCVLLALTVSVVAFYRAWVVRPDLSIKGSGDEPNVTEPLDTDMGTQPKVGGQRKTKDWYTILVLGRDTGGGGNTDTMMLASYNVTDQKMTVMSIPRDTMVNVPWDIKRINSVYNYYGGGDKGIERLYTEVSELVGFAPDYKVIIEWDAFGELVDAIGGVWFDVPRDMRYKDPYQDLVINVDKGYQLLDGEDAMGVIRWRHNNSGGGYATGDIGRIETQQAFMKAVVEQVLKVQNITKIKEFSRIFSEKVETDLTIQNLFWFGKSAIMGGLNMANVNFITMPLNNASCWSRSVGNMQSYVTPKPQEMLDLVNNELSPFVDPVTLRELDLMSVNKDGSVSSTSGKVADAKAAVPPVKPEKPKEEPVEETPEETPEGGETIPPVSVDPNAPGTGTTPPADGGTTTPGDGGTTTPDPETTPPDNGTVTPPDSGTTTPPEGDGGGWVITQPGVPGEPGDTQPPADGSSGGLVQ